MLQVVGGCERSSSSGDKAGGVPLLRLQAMLMMGAGCVWAMLSGRWGYLHGREQQKTKP